MLGPYVTFQINTSVRSKLKRQDHYLSQVDAQGRPLYLHAICLSSPSLHKRKFKIKRQYGKENIQTCTVGAPQRQIMTVYCN